MSVEKKENTKKAAVILHKEEFPEGYKYVTRRAESAMRKNTLKILDIWIKRYITQDVVSKHEQQEGNFVFYTKDVMHFVRVEKMMDEVAGQGYPSRHEWV